RADDPRRGRGGARGGPGHGRVAPAARARGVRRRHPEDTFARAEEDTMKTGSHDGDRDEAGRSAGARSRRGPLDTDQALREALLGSVRLDVPPHDLDDRVLRGLEQRRARARWQWSSAGPRALVASVIAVAAAVALWPRRAPRVPGPEVIAEPRALPP